MNCTGCVYFKDLGLSAEDGKCRRGAPPWPNVDRDDWCGEHAPVDETEAPGVAQDAQRTAEEANAKAYEKSKVAQRAAEEANAKAYEKAKKTADAFAKRSAQVALRFGLTKCGSKFHMRQAGKDGFTSDVSMCGKKLTNRSVVLPGHYIGKPMTTGPRFCKVCEEAKQHTQVAAELSGAAIADVLEPCPNTKTEFPDFDTLRRALVALERVTKEEFIAALRKAHPHVDSDYIAGKYRLYRQAPVGWLFNRTSSVEVDAILEAAHAYFEAGC